MFGWDGRLARLTERYRQQGLDAFVVSSLVNLRYLTGFAGSSGLLVSHPNGHSLVTDGRYEAFVRGAIRRRAIADVDLERVDLRYDLTLGSVLARLGPRQVGFEADHVTVATLERWRGLAPRSEWRQTTQVVEDLRRVKDADELEVLRRGGRALSDVARSLGAWLRSGRTELEIARDIDRAIERAGFERPAFDTIVASGPNSAFPHARPTARRLEPGDLVVLDFGGVLDGYCVDLTRMAGVGEIGSAGWRIYDAVRCGQDAALAAIRAGARGTDVDGAARAVLDTHGFGAAFVHGTGHGLGLEVHEAPRLARSETGAQDVLEAGMVCTVEPGAYVEGVGGVRLEDDVVVTIGGSELLTDAPRDLLIV